MDATPAHDLAPVIVTSPAVRCGTTLVQRLLCSSSNARIYGEACAQDLELLLGAFAMKENIYRHHRSSFVARRAGVEAGEVNDWILDLMPDLDGYAAALQGGILAGVRFCRDDALAAGRPVFGFKIPGWPPQTVRLVRRLLPGARWVAIERDLTGCLQSAKAWQPMPSREAVRRFCGDWAANVSFWRSLDGDPSTLVLDFDGFTGDPAAGLRRLAAFTGAQGMDPDVFAVKINTRRDEGSYVWPATLTAEERRLVAETEASLATSRASHDGISLDRATEQ